MARPGQLVVHMERVLPAPPSVVFRALTDADELAKWWGPMGFTAPGVDVDLRVGGRYRIAMQPPDAECFYLAGEYREVDPPRRLAYTFRWEDPDPEDQDTLVTLELRDLGGATALTLEHATFRTERRRALHDGGWTDSFNRLQQLLATPTSPEP